MDICALETPGPDAKLVGTLSDQRQRGVGMRKSLFGAACFAAQPLLLNAISVPALAIIIRKLGETGYGAWMTSLAIVATTSAFSALGIRSRFVRTVAQHPSAVGTLLAAQIGTRVILTAMAASLAIVISIILRYPPTVIECVAIGGLGIVLNGLMATGADVLQAFERLPWVAAANMAGGVVLTVASVVVVWSGGRAVAVSLSYLLGPLVSSIMLLVFVRRLGIAVRADLSLRRTVSLVWSCRYLGLHQMLSIVNLNAASLILPKLIGLAPFGSFAAGNLIQDRLGVVPDAIATALYPGIAKCAASDRRLAARRALWGIALAICACVPVALAVSLVGPWIAHVLFPRKFANCEAVIRITIWALPLVGIDCAMGYSLIAAGREASQARATLLGVVFGLVLGIPLILRWGLIGACWFVLIRPAVQIAFRTRDFLETFPIRSPSDRSEKHSQLGKRVDVLCQPEERQQFSVPAAIAPE